MDNIESLLKEKGITKTAFSEMLGIKKQNLNSLMRNPTMETMRKFAKELNVPMWQLFASKKDIIGDNDGHFIKCPKCSHEFEIDIKIKPK